MARDHAEINLGIWGDADFRALPPNAQHLYFVLWTAADLSYCGVTRWHPGKISQRAEDWTKDAVIEAASVLIDRHFIVVDEDPEEVLLRSWIRWDGLMAQPIMAASMAKAFNAVDSNTIRAVLIHELRKLREREPDLKGWAKPQVERILDQPSVNAKTLPNPFAKTAPNPSTNPPANPYIQSGSKGSTNPPSTPTPTPTPYSSSDAEPERIDIGQAARLTAGWIESCRTKPPRALQKQVRGQIQELIDDHVDPEHIRRGIAKWAERGTLGPRLIPNLVHEAANYRTTPEPMNVLNEHMPDPGEPTW